MIQRSYHPILFVTQLQEPSHQNGGNLFRSLPAISEMSISKDKSYHGCLSLPNLCKLRTPRSVGKQVHNRLWDCPPCGTAVTRASFRQHCPWGTTMARCYRVTGFWCWMEGEKDPYLNFWSDYFQSNFHLPWQVFLETNDHSHKTEDTLTLFFRRSSRVQQIRWQKPNPWSSWCGTKSPFAKTRRETREATFPNLNVFTLFRVKRTGWCSKNENFTVGRAMATALVQYLPLTGMKLWSRYKPKYC